MSRFNSYFLMKPEDVVEYVRKRLDMFDEDSSLECREIGDGNLNYVFRVWDKKSNKSVIVKQAGDTARISDEFKLSTDRNRIESDILSLEGELAPGLVPKLYKYDEIMNCCAMEDLSDHVIMRKALLEHRRFPLFADHITTFMVNTLLLTSDVVLEHKEKKARAKSFINPELCEITEDLVYTEPYNDCKGRNDVFPPNLEWVRKELYGDNELRLEAAKLKFEFMTNAQALLHGDLHTGSIFITENSTKVIDPEFAFYGPMGYDIGNVIANLIFAWANALVTIEDKVRRRDYMEWLEETIAHIIDMFKIKFLTAWEENATEVFAREEGFREWYLDTVIRDTAAAVGLELNRRIVGLAHVRDITSIENQDSRLRAERICMVAAKNYIKKRGNYKTGEDFIITLKEVEKIF